MSEEKVTSVATESRAARTIGDTGKYINGLAFKPTDWGDEGMPIIRIQNLTNPTRPLNKTKRSVDPVYVVNPGDILVSWSATLDAFIWDREPALLNQHIFKVVPDTSVVTKKFLFYTLKKSIAEMIKSEHLHGSTMKHINRGPFLAHKIEIPTLEEQEEIVAELETQFSRLDEAVVNLQRVKANLKRYKASVLKAAVEGRLVETEASIAQREGRSYETGEQLLQRILEDRQAKWAGRGKYKEPCSPDANDFYVLPEGWVWASGDQLTSVITDGEHITPRRTPDGVLLLSARNVLNGSLALEDVDYVPEEEYERIARRIEIQAGDVLLSCSGTVGRSCVVPSGLRFTLVRSVAVLRPVIVLAELMAYMLQSPLGQSQIDDRKTQTAQANLFQGKIRQLVFALPPITEQVRIVAELDRHMSIIREVESEVDANLQRAQALRQSTLFKAFATA